MLHNRILNINLQLVETYQPFKRQLTFQKVNYFRLSVGENRGFIYLKKMLFPVSTKKQSFENEVSERVSWP